MAAIPCDLNWPFTSRRNFIEQGEIFRLIPNAAATENDWRFRCRCEQPRIPSIVDNSTIAGAAIIVRQRIAHQIFLGSEDAHPLPGEEKEQRD